MFQPFRDYNFGFAALQISDMISGSAGSNDKSKSSKGNNHSKKTGGKINPGEQPDGSTMFRVTVPDGVGPGGEFQVYARNRIVRVRCPIDSWPGQSLLITVPADFSPHPETPPPDSSNVWKIYGSYPPAYMVEIPMGTRPGNRFPVTAGGQSLAVTCPQNARGGMSLRIVPPVVETKYPAPKPTTQLFEVAVPNGVIPGSPFALMAGGVKVFVSCPLNAGPGDRIRFTSYL